jgi:uncharacterized protein (DUF1684 family)
MIKIIVCLSFLFVFLSCGPSKKPTYEEIIKSRRDYIQLGFSGPNSPLNKKDKSLFTGLSYYGVDSNFRVEAKIVWKLDSKPVRLIKDTTIESLYYPIAYLTFSIGDDVCELNGYTRSLDNKTEIFIPFYDLTSGEATYAGGRFLEAKVNNSDNVVLDFNLAYNPYCAYNVSYTCAVPPFSNDLKVNILAGEKKPSFLKP